MKTAYLKRLDDVRWRRKRDSIVKKHNNTCKRCCGIFEDKNLNVHHNYYDFSLEPWEYPDSAYATLCKNCHEDEHSDLKDACEKLFRTMRRMNIPALHIERMTVLLGRQISNGCLFSCNYRDNNSLIENAVKKMTKGFSV